MLFSHSTFYSRHPSLRLSYIHSKIYGREKGALWERTHKEDIVIQSFVSRMIGQHYKKGHSSPLVNPSTQLPSHLLQSLGKSMGNERWVSNKNVLWSFQYYPLEKLNTYASVMLSQATSTTMGRKAIDFCNNTRQTLVPSIVDIAISTMIMNGNNSLGEVWGIGALATTTGSRRVSFDEGQ